VDQYQKKDKFNLDWKLTLQKELKMALLKVIVLIKNYL